MLRNSSRRPIGDSTGAVTIPVQSAHQTNISNDLTPNPANNATLSLAPTDYPDNSIPHTLKPSIPDESKLLADDGDEKKSTQNSEIRRSAGGSRALGHQTPLSHRSRTGSAIDNDEEDKESEIISSKAAPRSRGILEHSQNSKLEIHYETPETLPLTGEPEIEMKSIDRMPVQVQPSAPAESDSEDSDFGEVDTISSEAVQEVYQRPLIYYRRQATARNRAGNYRNPPPDQPTQIFLPNNSICLGFPFSKTSIQAEQNDGNENNRELDNLVVFSSPTEEQISRAKIFVCLLYFLIPIDLGLISTLFFYKDLSNDTTFSNGTHDSLTFACTLIELILALIAIHVRDTRLLTAFIMIFYVDSLINLIRAYSVLQFTHFVIQLGICHVASQYKYSLTPTWFTPVQ